MPNYPRANNFDLLRLLFAYLVVLYHATFLAGHDSSFILFRFPRMAVDGFFVISGFLIVWSFERNSDLPAYACRRFFRIYPLYFAVVSVQTVVLSFLNRGQVSVAETLQYYGTNLLFLNFLKPTLGNVLEGLQINAINGSLWTLKIEVAFYLILPGLVMLKRRTGIWILFVIFGLSVAYEHVMLTRGHQALAHQLPGKMYFFCVGMMLFYFAQRVRISRNMAIGVAVALTVLVAASPWWRSPESPSMVVLYAVVLGLFVYMATFFLPIVSVPRDISYGVYVLHFPICQLLLIGGARGSSMPVFLLLVLTFATLGAYLSARFLEERAVLVGKSLIKLWVRPSRKSVSVAGAEQ